MKKLILLLVLLSGLVVTNCKTEKKRDYAQISGQIKNIDAKELLLQDMQGKIVKRIGLDENGNFSDTLRVKKGIYILNTGQAYFKVFLLPDSDMKINADAENFSETLTFEGEGIDENKHMLARIKKIEKIFDDKDSLFSMEADEFHQSLKAFEKDFDQFAMSEDLDSLFVAYEKDDNAQLFSYLKGIYKFDHENMKMKGKPSPEFNDYENADGSKTSLKDLRGKYVYIDNWATWCKPCVREIPYLKKLEEKYGDKIHFVSISLDKPQDHNKWLDMIKEKGMKGIQLFAGEDQSFAAAYHINSIPRFIIIDPQGNVYNPDAPRPSEKKTDALLAELANK